ncbi:LuxR C-terminal-related transcriptional regulator [Nocardioides tweenelious]|uniref:helix-turn-helix transcriptional regulator n=1 Tax=Nocardioides tweenelious TaxID=3156607 RepID=UPI003CCCCB0F
MTTKRDVGARPLLAPSPDTPHPPQLFIPRPRLETFLEAVPTTPVTLVVAPAGSGKTAAAAAWSERVRRTTPALRVSWVRADQTEQIRAEVTAMRCPEVVEGPEVVVIDDVHLIGAEAADLLTDILSRDAESVRLLLIGRAEPPLVPVSVALAGSVRSLRVDDLRFTADEASALVHAHHPGASADDITAVLEQGDGWAAALVLGSRALAGSADTANARAALAATRQPVLDYLLHEVFEGLPGDLAHVLLTTCQEPEVAADEAVLLSGVPHAADVLDRAAAAGLLVTGYTVGSDVTTTGWRYHPLLLDLLRRRTAPTGPDWAVVVHAHQRATEVYVDRRDAARAVHHARQSGDLDLQLRVLREFSAELISRGQLQVVADALSVIPLGIRSRHHDLLVLQALVLRAQGRIDAAKAASDRALEADARSLAVGSSRDIEAQLAILELWQARFGWRESDPAIARAGRVLGCRHDGVVSAHDLAGMSPLPAAWLCLELAYFQTWLGDFDVAAIHVQDAAMYARQVDLPLLERAVLAQRAVLEMIDGAYQSALASADSAAELEPPGAIVDVAAARSHLVRGWSMFQELRVAEAEESLTAFAATPPELMDPLLITYGRMLQACVLAAKGEIEAARRVLDSRGDVPRLLPSYLERIERLVRMFIAIAMGDLTGAESHVRPSRDADAGVDVDSETVLGEAVLIGLGGDEVRAVRILNDLLPHTLDRPSTTGLGAAVARVAFLQRIGTPASLSAAADLMPDLLSRAAPQRLLWMLSLGNLLSPGFVDLVAAQATGPAAHPFAADALAALTGHPRAYPDLTPHRTAGRLGVPDDDARTLLTARELEVLQQLALGGGNADLARALFVSENTVKTHLASIYRKLEVDRRVDALRAARSRGLV